MKTAKSEHKGGRRKGGGVGAWHRTGRGWYAGRDPAIPLRDQNGHHIKDRSARADADAAYARLVVRKSEALTADDDDHGLTVRELCVAYVQDCKRRCQLPETDEAYLTPNTYNMHKGYCFDFCEGLPKRFCSVPANQRPSKTHRAFGDMPVRKVELSDIKEWLAAHPQWVKSGRTATQSIKAAFNYGKLQYANRLKHWANPFDLLRGMKGAKKQAGFNLGRNTRVVYISPEQEALLVKHAAPELALALFVMIRTGMRPICEFAELSAEHAKTITTDGGKTYLAFAKKTKGGGTRDIPILPVDHPEFAKLRDIFAEQMAKHPTGPLFRTKLNKGWTSTGMQSAIRKLRAKILKLEGVRLGSEYTAYAARHTYAKSMLHGRWNGGKNCHYTTLADYMGNTPEVCYAYYVKDTKTKLGLPIDALFA